MAFIGPYPTTFSANTGAMVVSHTTFSGGVTNTGTIGAGGISVSSSTFLSGGIVDTGVISGGIRVDGHSRILASSGTAIAVINATTLGGGISNAGIISATGNGVLVSAVTAFAGGITNSGSISGRTGIDVAATASFAGGIANGAGGTIAASRVGVFVSGVTSFVGGIVNRAGGTISASATAIAVDKVSTFSGGINNAGAISAGRVGIVLAGVSRSGNSVMLTALGGISNSGKISVKGTGVAVGAGAMHSGASVTLRDLRRRHHQQRHYLWRDRSFRWRQRRNQSGVLGPNADGIPAGDCAIR